MAKCLEGSNGKTRAVIIFSFTEDPVYSSKPFYLGNPNTQEMAPEIAGIVVPMVAFPL